MATPLILLCTKNVKTHLVIIHYKKLIQFPSFFSIFLKVFVMDETRDEFVIEEYHPKILLFENVTNAGEIREKIVNSSLPCAAINPRYVRFKILINLENDAQNISR